MTTIELSHTPISHSPDSQRIRNLVVSALAAWATAVFALSLNGTFNPAAGGPQWATLAAIALPLMMFAASWRASAGFRRWILDIDLHSILLLHTWRMVGLGFVFLYAADELPGVFALPAGLGDAAAAAWATGLAYALAKGRPVSVAHLRRWNTFGLMDFIIAVTIGTFSRSDPADVVSASVTTDALGTLPLSLIPALVVPFLVITHICVAMKLRHSDGGSPPA